MGQKISGIAYVKVDGTQLTIKGKAEYNARDVNSEVVMALAGAVGRKETGSKPMLKLDAVMFPNFPRLQLDQMRNGTVTFEAANGDTYSIFEAFLEGEHSFDAVEGVIELTFTGMRQAWSS